LKTFKHFLQLTKNLIYLNISKCSIEEDLGAELFWSFRLAVSMSKILMSSNNLWFGAVESLANSLLINKPLYKYLEYIDISDCHLSDEETIRLTDSLL